MPPLAVAEYGPQGAIDEGAEPRVRFNQQVAPLGEAMLVEPNLRIELLPKVKGRTHWRTPELLVFEPETLAPAQRYQARVVALPSASEALKRLFAEHPLTFFFETPGPIPQGSYPEADVPPEDWSRRQPVIIRLTQPVNVNELRKVLTVRMLGPKVATAGAAAPSANPASAATPSVDTEDAGPISVRVEPVSPRALKRRPWASALIESDDSLEHRLFQVRPAAMWPVDRTIGLQIAAGLIGRLGPTPSATSWRLTWKTPGPLRIESLRAGEGDCAGSTFTMQLSERITRAQLAHIHVAPRPPKTVVVLTNDWDREGGQEVEIRGAFVPAQTYTVRVDPGLRDVNGYTVGDGTAGRPWTSTISVAGQPSLQISGSGIFPATTPPVFGLTTRWVQTLRVRAAVLDPARAARALFTTNASSPPHTFESLAVPSKDIVVRDYVLPVKGPTAWSDLAVDLGELIGDRRGIVLVQATPLTLAPPPPSVAAFTPPPSVQALLRRTDLGPVAFHSLARSVIKVVRLSDAHPVAGATVSRLDGTRLVTVGQTDAQGRLVLPGLPARPHPSETTLVVQDPATHDLALVPPSPLVVARNAADQAGLLAQGERLMLHLTTDRDAYRPAESLAVVGFALVDTPFTRSGLRLLPAGSSVVLRVADGQQKTVVEQTLPLDAQGKFWARVPIPANTRLGGLHLTAQAQGATTAANVKLEDFRTPEFEVTTRPARDAILIGERVPVTVRAQHYSGVPVTFEKVTHASSCRSAAHAVPGLEVGWRTGDETHSYRVTTSATAVVTGAKGQSSSIVFTPELVTGDRKSLLCTVSTEVEDASHQAVGAESSVRVHPASFYLAVRPPTGVYAGEATSIPVRALTLDGQRRAAGNVEVKVTRKFREEVHFEESGRERTRWEDRKEVVAVCHLAASLEKDAVCRVERLQKGHYAIEATARDGSRTARTVADFFPWERPRWTPGKPAAVHDEAPRSLEVQVARAGGEAPERPLVPGDHLNVTVRSPCAGGSGIALLERAGVREQQDFVLANHEASLAFTVDDTWTPGVELEVLTVCRHGELAKDGAPAPQVERTSRRLEVSDEHRVLKVDVSAPAQARPGQTIPLSVTVRDADARPVKGGHVALWAVDEAVLSLGDYRIDNPLARLLPRRSGETATTHEFSSLLRAYQPMATDPLLDRDVCGEGVGGLGYGSGTGSLGTIGHGGSGFAPPARARFETTPIFLGEVGLDQDGKARIEGRLPDNLTTFRITALASASLIDGVSPGRFGVGESSVQVSAPFILRPVLPRHLRPGDTAEIAAVVQNQTGEAGRVVVEAALGKAPAVVAFIGTSQREAALAANGQWRAVFTVRGLRAGTAHVELRARFVPAKGDAQTDAVTLSLPVAVEPTLVERAATYGTLDTAAPIAVATGFPTGVAADTGGLSVAFSTSLLGELQDAFQYLLDYPYGCIEQSSSRVLSLIAARELGQRFGLDDREAALRLTAGIERMLSMQTASGGFAYWPGETQVHPYASAFATWILVLAQRAGAAVPAPALDMAMAYLDGWVRRGGTAPARDRFVAAASVYPGERAIALQVLAEAGRPLPKGALDEALAERATLPSFARSLLLSALARAGDARAPGMVEELLSSMTELPATAHVRETSNSAWHELFDSQSRSDAIALRVLMQVRPEHPLVPKLVRGLLEARGQPGSQTGNNARWRNTQENAYALLAVLEYARRFETPRPELAVRAWVGPRPLMDATLGASSPSKSAFVPMAELLRLPAPVTVVLQRQGTGRLAYRMGTTWRALGDELPPRNQGFAIERRITVGGTDRTKAVPIGEAVNFDLTFTTRTTLSYVAIEVPVPAGLEPVLDNLGRGHPARAWSTFVSHEERHPDRVLLFIDHLSPGEHRHTVQLRATTAGEFALPPARAEAMYMPEVYGRTSGARLTVSAPTP